MKKTILGAVMFFAGLVSCSILLGGSMGIKWTHNDEWASAWWLLSKYGLSPIFYIFVVLAIVGLVIAVWGVCENK